MAGPVATVSDARTDPPPCRHCGRPVGVYEPLIWRRPDGALEACGWLSARERPEHAHPLSAFFHADCVAEAT